MAAELNDYNEFSEEKLSRINIFNVVQNTLEILEKFYPQKFYPQNFIEHSTLQSKAINYTSVAKH